MSRLLPRQPVPDLVVPTLMGDTWSVATAKPQRFSLIVFYRGLHCPICTTYVAELDRVVPDLRERGVEAITISSDTVTRARPSTSPSPRIIPRAARREIRALRQRASNFVTSLT